MTTLRIEHSVPDFEGWKQAFDNDPADRKGSGVRRYQVSRSVEDRYYGATSSSTPSPRPRDSSPPCVVSGARTRARG